MCTGDNYIFEDIKILNKQSLAIIPYMAHLKTRFFQLSLSNIINGQTVVIA
jgi:hypothetical protein